MLGNHPVKKQTSLDVNGNDHYFRERNLGNIKKTETRFVNIKNSIRVPAFVINIDGACSSSPSRNALSQLETAAIESKIPPAPRRHPTSKASTSRSATPPMAWAEERFQSSSSRPKDLSNNYLQLQSSTLPEKKSQPKKPPSTIIPKGLAEKRWEKIQASNATIKGNRQYFVNTFHSPWESKEKIRTVRKVPSPEECPLPIRRLMKTVLPEAGKCLCQRPTRTVLCRFCGYHCQGNVKAVCSLHPMMDLLHAIDICPKCKAPDLLTEINLD